MAVPSSGEISLRRVASERYFSRYVNTYEYEGIDYSTTPIGPASLKDLSQGNVESLQFPYYDPINTDSPSKPNQLAPHAMSEFYGYDEDYISSLSEQFYKVFRRRGWFLSTYIEFLDDPLYPIVIVPEKNQDPFVLFDESGDQYSRWRQVHIPVDQFKGKYIRPYALFTQSNLDFRNDVALSGEWWFLDSNLTTIDTSSWRWVSAFGNVGQWGTTLDPSNQSQPEGVLAWQDIDFNEDSSLPPDREGRWSIDQLETASNGTGPFDEARFAIQTSTRQYWTSSSDSTYRFIGSGTTRSKYFYFEASGSYSTPKYAWWRFKDFKQVPQNADFLTFCYSAWSQDKKEDWENDILEVFFEVFSIEPPPTFS